MKAKHIGIVACSAEGAALARAIPEVEHREHINNIIFKELVYGVLSANAHECFRIIIDEFKQHGCDAVVLGCTEIPLLVSETDSSLPILDSTKILAKAALRNSLSTQN